MALGCITTLWLSCKIIKSLYLFKRLANDMGGQPLTAQETSCTNVLIIYLNIDNSILYTKGNACGITDILIIKSTLQKWRYLCIAWSAKALHIRMIYLKVHRLIGNNPGHNTTNHLFTPKLRFWKRRKEKKRPSHWTYLLFFSPHKPITHWFYIEVL